MKKGLYIAFEFVYNSQLLDKEKSSVSGIERKIYFQYKVFEKYGYKMHFYNPYINRKHSIERVLRRLVFHSFIPWNINYAMIQDIDFIYVRKAWFMDGDFILFLKKVKRINPDIKIVLEIPTYPYDAEGKNIDMIPLKIKDKFWRKKLYKYIDKIITYSEDKEIFNISTINTSNAVDIKTCKRKRKSTTKYPINMIACASLYYWHGFDRAIEGIKNYYAEEKDNKVELNLYIVGNGEEYPIYQKLISKYSLEEHVFLVGAKYGEDLDCIYDTCQIGLDSMGRHRSGVLYNSSLKGKEYCAKGLMIVSGVRTELDDATDFDFYYRIPADDSPVNFDEIIMFYNNHTKTKSIDEIQEEIVEYADEHFDFSVVMKPIQEYIES